MSGTWMWVWERHYVKRKQRQNKKLGMEAEWDLRSQWGQREARNRSDHNRVCLESVTQWFFSLAHCSLLWLQMSRLPTVYSLQNLVIRFPFNMLTSVDFNSICYIKISLSSAMLTRSKTQGKNPVLSNIDNFSHTDHHCF